MSNFFHLTPIVLPIGIGNVIVGLSRNSWFPVLSVDRGAMTTV